MNGNGDYDPRRNHLLGGLDDDEFDRVAGLLEPYDASIRTQVHDPGARIEHVYFPLHCVFSLVAGVGRSTVEVNTIGFEGMVGLPVFLGSAVSPHSAFCQVPGPAVRIRSTALVDFLSSGDGSMHSRLHRYTQSTIVQLAQSVACNQLHSTEQRAARWLLMTRDRVAADTFPMTQQFLAQMLGVRRATVSGVATALQQAGTITYQRGVISIADTAALEATTCECYRLVRDEHEQLLDGRPGVHG
jgi:CRP-like cAMP-binding protein